MSEEKPAEPIAAEGEVPAEGEEVQVKEQLAGPIVAEGEVPAGGGGGSGKGIASRTYCC